jgi:hypothetical protein
MRTFEQTDISRQLKEASVPESAYLYVENLWCRNEEMREAFRKMSNYASSAKDEIEDVLLLAEKWGMM